jgi:signal transduction histidine kinase
MNKSLRILILEDMTSDAELVERELRKAEFVFDSRRVETREAFIQEIKEFLPDLILSDYSLPLFDGMAALKIVQEISPLTPLIVVTGSLNEETAVDCIKAGAADYVIKENLVRIGSAVKGALEKKRSREEKERAEEALRRQTEELARSNKELEQFAYVASHDLQEPLRKIITFGDRLKEQSAGVLDEMGRDYLQRMQHAAFRMKQLVEGLLQYATVTAKSENLQPVDLNVVISEVISDMEVSIDDLKADITFEKLPVFRSDAIQMRQLFQNLIANALKFRKQGVPPRVRISSRALPEGFIEIRVEDNGIGFDEKYGDKIFLPFQRLHSIYDYEGIGMGLTICHRIVQRHGGRIHAKSAPGKGSVFTVTLPREFGQQGGNTLD